MTQEAKDSRALRAAKTRSPNRSERRYIYTRFVPEWGDERTDPWRLKSQTRELFQHLHSLRIDRSGHLSAVDDASDRGVGCRSASGAPKNCTAKWTRKGTPMNAASSYPLQFRHGGQGEAWATRVQEHNIFRSKTILDTSNRRVRR